MIVNKVMVGVKNHRKDSDENELIRVVFGKVLYLKHFHEEETNSEQEKTG